MQYLKTSPFESENAQLEAMSKPRSHCQKLRCAFTYTFSITIDVPIPFMCLNKCHIVSTEPSGLCLP